MAVSETLQDHINGISERIFELRENIKYVDHFEENDKLLDISNYVGCTDPLDKHSEFDKSDLKSILRYNAFQWCFDNNILYKLIRLQVDNEHIYKKSYFILMEFKNQADLITFKHQWLS